MLPLKMCNAGYVRSVRCTSAPSTASLRLKQTSSRKLRSTAEDSSGEEQKPDIDALAAFLSKRAVEMRASMDEWDVMMSQEDSYAADEALDTLDGQTDAAASASAEAAAPKGAADLGQPVSLFEEDSNSALWPEFHYWQQLLLESVQTRSLSHAFATRFRMEHSTCLLDIEKCFLNPRFACIMPTGHLLGSSSYSSSALFLETPVRVKHRSG